MERYILAHDIGTSSDKAVLVRFDGSIRATASEPYPTHYPNPAWVEQDPADYWEAVCKTSCRVLHDNDISPESVAAVVFSTQAQGVIPVAEDGTALYPNITWVDGRAEKQAQRIMKRIGGKRLFTLLAGTPIMGKDCIAKIAWLKEERPAVYQNAYRILDVNGYLKLRCTGRMVAELSGASGYGFDLKKKTWLSVLPLAGIDMQKLPPLVKSTDVVGGLTDQAARETGLLAGTPVFGGCDDVQAAALGAGQTEEGDVHVYLGTSAWVAAATRTGDSFQHGAAAIQSADPQMNLIAGITESAGANIEWIRDQFFRQEKEKYGAGVFNYMDEVIATVPPGSDGLICTPWMLGERCPVSSTTTRATLFNISLVHTREHLMRAVYEGIAYNIRWILQNFCRDYGIACDDIRIIGGGALDKGWMQILSDVTGRSIHVVENPRNAGAVGAAVVALIGLGELPDFAAAKRFVRVSTVFVPNEENRAVYDVLFMQYRQLYHALSGVYTEANGKRFTGETKRA